ncbi:MAG TPA: lysophospholipid acyltransferase family protein [Abditibacteriaceae bacterium]|jgi:KDO2-lipid IV(A) lauroyltransferase
MNSRYYSAREGLEVRAMSAVAGAMERASWRTCRTTGTWLGLLFFHALKKRRSIAIDNIRQALGVSEIEATRLTRRSYQNFAMTFCEFLHMRAASAAEVREYSDIEDIAGIQRLREAGRGCILLTAHIGNWEVMGARAAQEFPLSVIARPTGNSGIETHIASVRASANMEVISKYDPGRGALQALRAGRALGILPDQHAGADGLLLPFFGRNTRVIPAVARLAMLSGAAVAPRFGVRRTPWLADGRIIARALPTWSVEKPERHERDTAVEAGTRRMIADLETIIRAHPDQWLWVHRRWRSEENVATSTVETGRTS